MHTPRTIFRCPWLGGGETQNGVIQESFNNGHFDKHQRNTENLKGGCFWWENMARSLSTTLTMRDPLRVDYCCTKGRQPLAMASTRSGRRSNANVTRKNSTSRRSKSTRRPKTPPTSSAKPVGEAKTMGEAIQLAKSVEDHLYICEKWVWLPSDADLPPHLRNQLV